MTRKRPIGERIAMVVYAPVSGAVNQFRYQEHHAGLPFLMRIFMGAARTFMALFIFGFSRIASEYFPPATLALLIFTPSLMFPYSKYDLLVRPAYRIFSPLLRQ